MKKPDIKIEKRHVINAVCAVVIVGLMVTWLCYVHYRGNQLYISQIEISDVMNENVVNAFADGVNVAGSEQVAVVSDEAAAQKAAAAAAARKSSSSSGGSYYSSGGEGVLTRSGGVNYYNGRKETWYSQRVLAGGGLNIPGRHVAEDGTIRDADGYICVAASDLPKGTVVETSLGTGKVYDTGCAAGVTDIYTDW